MKKTLALLTLGLLLQGCGATMSRYEPNHENLTQLRGELPLQPVRAPEAQARSGEDSIWVRNNPIRSPSGSLSAHLQQALNSELQAVGLIKADAPVRLKLNLLDNDLNTAIFGQGRGHLQVEFTLERDGQLLYRREKRVQHVWSSNFIGAIAIPRAAGAYNVMVQKLLAELYADPAFIAAMRQTEAS